MSTKPGQGYVLCLMHSTDASRSIEAPLTILTAQDVAEASSALLLAAKTRRWDTTPAGVV